MIDSVTTWVTVIEGWLVEPSASRAIVAGLALSWFGTQLIKKHILPKSWDDDLHKRITALVAFVLACAPTYHMWPADGGVFAALIIGVASPTVYVAAVKTLYRYLPWLEPKMSARPTKIVQTPEGYEERDITQPSNPDEKTIFTKRK